MQPRATLVMAPGNESIYIDKEPFEGDHADLDEIMNVLAETATENT